MGTYAETKRTKEFSGRTFEATLPAEGEVTFGNVSLYFQGARRDRLGTVSLISNRPLSSNACSVHRIYQLLVPVM